jgi:hypothetical protein
MSMSNNPNYYSATVKPILDAALAQGGARYTLPTAAKAIRWRFEAYHYRNLLHKAACLGLPKGTPTATEYDELTFSLEDNVVVIALREADKGAVLTDLQGKPLALGPTASDESLLEQVRQFKAARLME